MVVLTYDITGTLSTIHSHLLIGRQGASKMVPFILIYGVGLGKYFHYELSCCGLVRSSQYSPLYM